MATPGADVRSARPLTEPRFGLIASASRGDAGGFRWGHGLKWLPELHASTSEAFGARELDCTTAAIGHGSDDKAVVEQAYPILLYAFDWCSTLELRDYEGRALRLLQATRSMSLAREFWEGTIAAAEGLSNSSLKSASTIVTTGATAPAKALAKLDAAVCARMANGPGAIHCTIEVLGRLMADDAIRLDGSQWVTATGTRVIADAGYTGDLAGQAGNTEWMVGTSPVEVILGPVETFDLGTPEGLFASTVFDVNDTIVWAQQPALVLHEPNLCLVAAQVDLS